MGDQGPDGPPGPTYSAGFGLALQGTTFSVDPVTVQRRVDGSCVPGNSIRAIAQDGTVTCEPTGGGSLEAWHEIGAVGEPPFENGWGDYIPSQNSTAAFYKVGTVIHVKGLITGTGGTIAFTLPAGYRPPLIQVLPSVHDGQTTTPTVSSVLILADGSVIPNTGESSGGTYALDGIEFRTD